jgi:chromosome segregation ATPase
VAILLSSEEDLKRALSDRQTRVSSLENDLRIRDSLLKTSRETVKKLQSEKDTAHADYERMHRERMKELQDQLSTADARAKAFEQESHKKLRALKKATTRLEETQAVHSEAKQLIKRLQEQLAEKEKSIECHNRAMHELREDKIKVESELDSMKKQWSSEGSALKCQMAETERTLQERMAKMGDRATKAQERETEWRSRVTELERFRNKADQEVARLSKCLQEETGRRKRLEARNNEAGEIQNKYKTLAEIAQKHEKAYRLQLLGLDVRPVIVESVLIGEVCPQRFSSSSYHRTYAPVISG